MPNYKYYHVYLVPAKGISSSSIERKMNLAVDWFQYDSNCWILYSTSSIDKLMRRFRPLVRRAGNLFIAEFDPDTSNGWMPQDFWNWFDNEE